MRESSPTVDKPADKPAAKPKRSKAAVAAKSLVDERPAAAPGADPARREELIRHAAYRRFEARGGHHGHHGEDWADAEREVDGILGPT